MFFVTIDEHRDYLVTLSPTQIIGAYQIERIKVRIVIVFAINPVHLAGLLLFWCQRNENLFHYQSNTAEEQQKHWGRVVHLIEHLRELKTDRR